MLRFYSTSQDHLTLHQVEAKTGTVSVESAEYRDLQDTLLLQRMHRGSFKGTTTSAWEPWK